MWATAIRQILRCYHPQGKLLLLQASFPHLVTVPIPEGFREVDVAGFSAGSYTGLAFHELLNEFGWVGGWSPRYLAHKRERGPARVSRLLSEGKLVRTR